MFRHRQQTSHGEQLARIYREHATAVYRFAYHLTGSREDAEDVLQAAFLEAHRRLQAGEQLMNPAAWLTTVVRHRAYKLHRDRREVPLPDETLTSLPAVPTSDADAELRSVRAVLLALPEAQHHAFVLRHWSGLSVREIATVMETTEKAVESLLVRARSAVLAERELAATCLTVREHLAEGSPAPLHALHLHGCPSCRRAQQRLAWIAGVAAAIALVPRLHTAQALAASIPGFTVASTEMGSGAAAAASGTGKLAGAKILAAMLAVTVATGTAAQIAKRSPGPEHRHPPAATTVASTGSSPERYSRLISGKLDLDRAPAGTDNQQPGSGHASAGADDEQNRDANGNENAGDSPVTTPSTDLGGDSNSQADQGSPSSTDNQGPGSQIPTQDSGNSDPDTSTQNSDQQPSDSGN